MVGSIESVSKKVSDTIRRVLREQTQDLGLAGVEVHPGLDHDGDPVLFVDAYYRYSEAPLPVGNTFGVITNVRTALRKLGEERFPHVRFHFDERQEVALSS